MGLVCPIKPRDFVSGPTPNETNETHFRYKICVFSYAQCLICTIPRYDFCPCRGTPMRPNRDTMSHPIHRLPCPCRAKRTTASSGEPECVLTRPRPSCNKARWSSAPPPASPPSALRRRSVLRGRQNRFGAGVPYLQRQPRLSLKPERLPRGGPKPDLGLDEAQEGILPKTQP